MADDETLVPGSAWAAMATATLAGLSTAIGGGIAVARKPDEADLGFLLGTAIGVMSTVSLELWASKAWDRGALAVTAAVALGAAAFAALDKAVPAVEDIEESLLEGKEPLATGRLRNPAALLRLGLLMALTMTLHNLPEGIAVAFSSGTDIGPVIAIAIAIHNIPEGVIVALPIYAATGSAAKAIGLATLSGLSETLGAALALFVLRPFVSTLTHLDYVLAAVGGVMLAVCVLELWPEAKRCRRPTETFYGIAAGALVMGVTLWIGI
ncbi:zinc permease family [Hyaloraphidium curvatum]|nr:zinc permease family [Hyaloraphidium curvatum]